VAASARSRGVIMSRATVGVSWIAGSRAHADREPSLSLRDAGEKTTCWQGVKGGRFPNPVNPGPKTTVWRAEDILALSEPGALSDG
jgi:hypothetical protein